MKDELMELLRQGQERELARRAGESPRAARWLLGRVWDADETLRRHAAGAVGWAAADRPELGLELARRFLWALNDESATNGVHAVAALGEMGKRAPELLEPFLAPLASQARDEGLRPEILKAFLAVAETAPHLARPHLPVLERAMGGAPDNERSDYARLAALAGGREGS
jgi:hypothetical protein